jgi:hypothetical protein
MFTQHENMTLVERIHCYVDGNQPDKARALAKVGDYLEECWLWEIDFGRAIA